MSDKRPADAATEQPRAKRSRFEPVQTKANGEAGAAQKAAVKPSFNGLSALEKAKQLLANKAALQAQIQALKERKALSASAQTSAPAAAPKSGPTPLRLDAQGRDARESLQDSSRAAAQRQEKGPRPEEFVDPNISTGALRRLERRRREGFDFVKAGSFQKEAEQLRLRNAFGDAASRPRPDSERRPPKPAGDALDPNLVPLGERPAPAAAPAPPEPIPDVEWWDAGLLLLDASQYGSAGDGGAEGINDKKITIYVEHPVPLEPPAEEAPPPPMPLPLTEKERKKLRTQRRVEKEKEKQELIRQGLLEPPKPKLKLSTFYRSMGVEAAADPTAIEQQVRADQEARMQAHTDRNLASKLTPAEKREKKIRKLVGAAKEGEAPHVSVFRINSLSTPQLRFKVKANAEELHMTGCVVVTDSLAVVVAEGGPKAQKKYGHLLLKRIRWNPEAEDDDDDPAPADRQPNQCVKVWSGTVKAATFDKIVMETCRTEAAARKFLADRGVEHYWDLAIADQKAE